MEIVKHIHKIFILICPYRFAFDWAFEKNSNIANLLFILYNNNWFCPNSQHFYNLS